MREIQRSPPLVFGGLLCAFAMTVIADGILRAKGRGGIGMSLSPEIQGRSFGCDYRRG